MNGSTFPAPASRVTVALAGVGSYLPDHRVGNEEILRYLRPARPDGRLLEPDWVVRHLGIQERRLDYEFGGRRKRSRKEGAVYDGDLALRAGRSALADAAIAATDVDLLVHVTSTPDTVACQDHLRFLTRGLGLRADTELVHHNLGCAGLAPAFRTAAATLISTAPATALVIASNCPSGYFDPAVHDSYYKHPSGMGWLTPLMFADGAGAAVFRSAHRGRDARLRGLLSVRYETNPEVELVSYPAGGCLRHTSPTNISDHVFLMDAVKVAEVFPALMIRDLEMLREDWPTTIKPVTGTDFDVDSVARWYLHQANGVVVRQAVEMLGLPADRVPISVDRYGNTSAASTLIMLDEDRRAGRVTDGDLLAFLWIGAGNGAMNGYATMLL
ncbi:MAG TPA: 3-oxoacyl-[acyl-carrier-protein] synthase III C-terminal domain-containing protein [Streptosporangiaceae bacterium]|nr:3-oxoacyl-[acyl-carrier-protein] synthase III C-terminal domain-containing protein [Streptosporangiaceae bacterium]